MGELSLYRTVTYKTTTCITCGVDIVMATDFYDHRLKDQKMFYCPSGHQQHFIGETEEQRLRKLLETERRWLANEKANFVRVRERAEAAERREAAQKGVVTRLKNRSAAGLCSCCNRSFQNLRKHMLIKHPEQVKAAGRDV